ncbi:MAG: hypothetical protein U9O89_05125 [Thermoproteota archaeon]|nr:hypothetical protein [Thermoproteota archaeon]
MTLFETPESRIFKDPSWLQRVEKLFKEQKDEYIVRRAVSIKGMLALAAAGFTKFDEANGVHLYRKPKP